MRGQRLFVRPIEPGDDDAVRAFLGGPEPPRSGLVGKLVGNLVAVLSMEVTPDAIRVDDLVVAQELRRKRIGRVMLNELADLASKMEREWLVVDLDRERTDAREFLLRVGFVEEEDGRMKRKVR